jgi:MFS family permease
MVAVSETGGSGAMRALRMLVLMAGPVLAGMVQLAILPAMPGMADHFTALGQDGLFIAQNVTTIAAPAMALGAPFVGWLAGRLGKRPVLLATMLLYGLSGVAGAFAPDLTTLLASRVVLGVASAGYTTVAIALIGDYYPGEGARERLLGWFAVVGGGGSLVTLQAAGMLTKGFGWLSTFGLYAVALPLFALALFVITPPKADAEAAAGSDSRASIWTAWHIYALIILISISMYAVTIQGPFLMTERGITDSVVVSNVMLMSTVGSMLGAYLFRFVRPALGFGLTLAATWGVLAVANIGFASSASPYLLALCAGFTGLGSGLMQPLTQVATLSLVAPAAIPRAMGMAVGCIFAGQFLHPFVAGPLRSALGLGGAFMALGAASAVLALLAALWGLRRGGRATA